MALRAKRRPSARPDILYFGKGQVAAGVKGAPIPRFCSDNGMTQSSRAIIATIKLLWNMPSNA